ncbi:ribosomal protein S30 [Calliopsis andreniformis]|uniref:ribosomal protein S30 n=1 Tax=Calliopsis andreniformis TaxID=337506 RepID=UPI003FCCB4B2
MQLHVRGEHTTIVDTSENESIADIKRKIVQLEAAGNTEFNLYCSGHLLGNETLVGELTSNVLELTVSLPGGKVHGSLARAGKVKAQTPKVEKQEKSKKKTGRAKRRIQYNRRFVNVVQTFGRRRGPNANPNS